MDHKLSRIQRILLTILLVGGALLLAISPAQALNNFLKSFSAAYPATTTDNAGCSTCHAGSSSTLNAYGRDVCLNLSQANYLALIEGIDSDGDGTSNLEEINANSQPGWTVSGSPVYFTSDHGCEPTGGYVSAPAEVPLPYDPPTGGDPVAVPGGPYSGYVNIAVSLNGSASYDSDGGAIVSYSWDFGDGTTGSGAAVQHTYSAAATYTVTLTVVDEEGVSNSAATSVVISGSAVLDLDIASFTVSSSVKLGKAVAISLGVENPGPVLGQSVATLVGSLNGVEVYRWQLNVYDNSSKGATTFTFPAYTPKSKGTITWTATIADLDPDLDQATASTLVK